MNEFTSKDGITFRDMTPDEVAAILAKPSVLKDVANCGEDTLFSAHKDDHSIIMMCVSGTVQMIRMEGATREKRTQAARMIIGKVASQTGNEDNIISPKQPLN